MSGKIIDFDKLKDYPQNSYAFLWVVLCVVVALVHLTAAVLISKSANLKVSAASGSLPPGCTLSTGVVAAGGSVKVTSVNGLFGTIGMQGNGISVYTNLGNLTAGGSTPIVIPLDAQPGIYTVRVGSWGVGCIPNLNITPPGGGGGTPVITCSQVDFDHDGKISILDLTIMSKAFGSKVGDAKYNKVYDLDNDGVITTLDLTIATKYFGKNCLVFGW